MGAEYARWLVAKASYFLPEHATITKFVEALRSERWIVDPASPDFAHLRFDGPDRERAKTTGGFAVTTVDNTFGDDERAKLVAGTEPQPLNLTREWLESPKREELRLVWPVFTSGETALRYPLSGRPAGPLRYTLEIHRALEYVFPSAENLEPIATACACGEDLEFEWDDEELVPAFTESTGIFAECEACSRTFDPTKSSAVIRNPFDDSAEEVRGGAAYRFAIKVACGEHFAHNPKLQFAPELVALVEKQLGRSFHEFGVLET